MKKYVLCLKILIIVVCIATMSGCNKGDNKDATLKNNVITSIVVGDDKYELRISNTEGWIDYYFNDDLIKNSISEYNGDKMIVLPTTEEVNDFSSIPKAVDGVYKVGLSESAKYVRYLLNNNFTIDLQANTTKFVEIYLSNNETKESKRLIITNEYIVMSDVEYNTDIEININDYIF